jgi:hypothetical protein
VARVRIVARAGVVAGIGILAVGLGLAGGAALAAGDWGLAREPWIGTSLTLILAGLALTALSAVLVDLVEPLGLLRLVALPPALALGSLWGIYLAGGQATSGYGGSERDLRIIFYSEPKVIIWFIALTALMLLAPAISWVIKRRRDARSVKNVSTVARPPEVHGGQ